MRMLLREFVLLGVILCLTLVGCGSSSDYHQVHGKVTLKGGGPVSQGLVTFTDTKGTTSSSGRIEEDGSYSLSTSEEGDGVPAGEYQVTISAIEGAEAGLDADPDAPAPAGDEIPEEPKSLIDLKYNSKDTSGLKATVKEGSTEFNFEVDPPPAN